MTGLPVLASTGEYLIADPDTGEAVTIDAASDRALAATAERIAQLDRELFAAKRAVAAELRDRHGVGKASAGGYRFTVRESASWPVTATRDALEALVTSGAITAGEARRAMPDKPKPDSRQLKALLGRLVTSDPEAARVLADACTVSPASVGEIEPDAVNGNAEVDGSDVLAGLQDMQDRKEAA